MTPAAATQQRNHSGEHIVVDTYAHSLGRVDLVKDYTITYIYYFKAEKIQEVEASTLLLLLLQTKNLFE
jgi:hypothetical protein